MLVVSVLAAGAAAEVIAIRGATVIDGTGAAPRVATVVLDSERIAIINPGESVPPGARVIDARGKTLLPGLFDLHTHLLASGGVLAADWGKNLKAYLACGVTTVADMSTYPEQFEPMRRLIAGGLPAPRVLMAGRFSTPGGHGAEGGRGDFHTQEVTTPREARAAVQRFAAYKPDLIKVFTDGWRYGTDTDMTSMDEPTLKALVEESHKQGLKVVTHTVTVDKGKLAARAGVDIIIHGLGDGRVDAEWLSLMKGGKTGYVQTLAVYEPRGTAGSTTARLKRWMNLLNNGRSASEGGVLLGAGTDAGMTGTPHGRSSLHELELMVASGVTPLEAIVAATSNSARLLGVDKQRGTIEPGKLADLLLVDGNPAERIADIHKTARVWLGGREVDVAAMKAAVESPEPTPIEAVKAAALLDDFESANGRSRVDTLWLNNTDGGHDHARMLYARTLRKPGDHALTVLSEMTDKERPVASMVLPLARGGVEPVDARGFAGIEFECRGEGAFALIVQTQAVRDRRFFSRSFEGAAAWRKVRVPFSALAQPETRSAARWTGGDLLAVEFQAARKAGEKAWLEIDNVRFYTK
ncbi:MAG: amidohydrolase family protein [Candidatus Solibacter usitatus]|nr:amidohydrolase family protein [Candidatus Solibacter usitatus]